MDRLMELPLFLVRRRVLLDIGWNIAIKVILHLAPSALVGKQRSLRGDDQ
jgi:hypothetical protein